MMNMISKNNIVSVVLSGAKNLNTATVDAFRSFTAFRMTRAGGTAIRKATIVLCTLFSLLLISSCTQDDIIAPAEPLVPQGMKTVTVDFQLPEGKPAFGEGETRAITTDGTWAQGDELLMTLSVRNINEAAPDMGDISAAAAYLTLVYDGTAWDVNVDKSYSITVLDIFTTSSKPYAQQPLLTATEDLSLTEGLTLMLDEDFGEVDECRVHVIYSPDMGIMLGDDNILSISYTLKTDAITTAPEWWYAAAISTNGSLTLAWSENTGARLRVYTGTAGDVVTLTSEAFSPSFLRSDDYTYTATTQDDGYAYFYGKMEEQTSDFNVSLTAVAVDGVSAVHLDQPVILLEASTLVPVTLEAGKSYRLDAEAKRTVATKGMAFIDGTKTDLTVVKEQVVAAVAEGKTTFIVTGTELTKHTGTAKTMVGEAIRTSNAASGSIDLVLLEATSIPVYAFRECTALKSVSADKVKTIQSYVFLSCNNIQALLSVRWLHTLIHKHFCMNPV